MLRGIVAFGVICALSIAGAAQAAPPAPPPIEAYGKLPALDMVKIIAVGGALRLYRFRREGAADICGDYRQ